MRLIFENSWSLHIGYRLEGLIKQCSSLVT